MKNVKPKVQPMKKAERDARKKKVPEMVTLPGGRRMTIDEAAKLAQSETPMGGYNSVALKNKGRFNLRLMIGTPTTGLVRMEWVLGRFGQLIPTNWSHTDCMQFIHTYAPIEYLVADAQNLIVKAAIEQNAEWLLLIEHDNVLPPGMFIRLNEYMRDGKVPIVSGLYFTKSDPPEPMTYRGRGNSFHKDWKMGDMVWCDGVPTGTLLIHASILRKLWEESPEYRVNDQVTRRVFETPEKVWQDPETGATHAATGTSDLEFCRRVIEDKIFEKAGWPEFQAKEFPFLVDTNLFVRHITQEGVMYPLQHPKELGY